MKMIIHYTTSVCKALFVGVTTTVGVSCRMAFFCDDINTHKGQQNEKDNRAIMAGKYCSKTLKEFQLGSTLSVSGYRAL